MLPTKEEFQKKEKSINDIYEKPVYKCPECGGDVFVDLSVVYCSDPPKYRYFCKCGYKEIF